MQQLGREITLNRNKVHVKAGPAKGGSVQLPGDVSSQFISGLLLASPLMEDGLRMKLISRLESRGYVSMTIAMMKRHGVEVEVNDDMSFFQVLPRQAYKPTEHVIPGDYSSAAFPIAAAAVTESNVQVRGLEQNGSDPDSAILEILSKMGAATTFSSDALLVKGRALKAVNVNISDCPDLGPVIAVLGCCAEGETRITGAERLRYKESDRVSAITSQLRVLGAEVEDTGSGFLVSGPSTLHGGVVNSYGDHRIAMALSIAALNASEQVVIREAQCVTKSYPSFFDDIRSLGVEAVER
jgi:3-phosphoshikimate 1-carboxyvinyltransferase